MEIKIPDRNSNKNIKLDQNQIIVFKASVDLSKKIIKSFQINPFTSIIKNLFTKPKPIKSLYIYGKVGRGKSMLMRHFFDNLDISQKVYFHFNNFMQQIHKELHILRQNPTDKNRDLISLAMLAVIGKAKVLCFDEMQVEDVADAMILKGVFGYLMQNQITIVTTSNCHPLDLYENGLQRDSFIKFIKEILLKNFVLLNLDGKVDYRSKFISSKQHYFYPINDKNKKAVADLIFKVTDGAKLKPREIEVLGRKFLVKESYKNIVVLNFKELCMSDLGVADYQKICQQFSIIFLLNVPILKPEDRNEAKRLVWFMDEFYENKTKLLILADCKPEEIYVKGVGAKAFKRAASRMSEI